MHMILWYTSPCQNIVTIASVCERTTAMVRFPSQQVSPVVLKIRPTGWRRSVVDAATYEMQMNMVEVASGQRLRGIHDRCLSVVTVVSVRWWRKNW